MVTGSKSLFESNRPVARAARKEKRAQSRSKQLSEEQQRNELVMALHRIQTAQAILAGASVTVWRNLAGVDNADVKESLERSQLQDWRTFLHALQHDLPALRDRSSELHKRLFGPLEEITVKCAQARLPFLPPHVVSQSWLDIRKLVAGERLSVCTRISFALADKDWSDLS